MSVKLELAGCEARFAAVMTIDGVERERSAVFATEADICLPKTRFKMLPANFTAYCRAYFYNRRKIVFLLAVDARCLQNKLYRLKFSDFVIFEIK